MILFRGPTLCIRCITGTKRGEVEHECVDRGDGGPYRLWRDWRCDCPCRVIAESSTKQSQL